MTRETPIVFGCDDSRLVGILHRGISRYPAGAVIVVGGPQYRVGSHRQFVLMARILAAAGISTLRFDVRGMGDSEGRFHSFEVLDAEIRAAIDTLLDHEHHVSKIILIGLCDAASASLMYGPSDARVDGLILINPWVRTPQGEARTYLRHYYVERLLQRSFWQKLISGDFDVRKSLVDLFRSANAARADATNQAPFLDRMLAAWERFDNSVLLAISGRDLTAREFLDVCRADERWHAAVTSGACTRMELPTADHTMSDSESFALFMKGCVNWVRAIA